MIAVIFVVSLTAVLLGFVALVMFRALRFAERLNASEERWRVPKWPRIISVLNANKT